MNFEKFLFLTLALAKTIEANDILDVVIDTFEEEHKAFCVILMSETFQRISSSRIPIIATDFFNPPNDLKATSDLCKNHVFVVKNLNDLTNIDKRQLHVRSSRVWNFYSVTQIFFREINVMEMERKYEIFVI